MKAGGMGQPVGHRGDSSLKEKPDWRLGTGAALPLPRRKPGLRTMPSGQGGARSPPGVEATV